MPETVHWVGTGLSTGSGVAILADRTDVVLYGRTVEKAAACLDRLGLTGKATPRALADLAPESGEVVVSMLPATEHIRLLRLCLETGAHFANTSYVSDEIAEYSEPAREAGVVLLTEAGLDPGIDHLLAHDLVARAEAAVVGPATVKFTSYCGGVPAEPNEFRYRFSWAPRGVLTALLSEARYLADGEATVANRPWEATTEYLLRDERFEAYPNRDSLPFIRQYAIPEMWRLDTFVRGTLRLDGWLNAWAPVFAELRDPDPDRITALATELAAEYPTTDADRDRVVLAVALSVHGDNGSRYVGEYVLDETGTETESAMAKLVSTPLAAGVLDILAGRLNPGLHRAVDTPDATRRWFDLLDQQGVVLTLNSPQ
ncbi:saccharopine dehydrogenase family protein [Actinokineospora enzanensis]|uniref:saccharopine dehydrogenase family protein n=1 Tax=Actinokineospora enzanensis TaxID=155975 RepID=UPI000370DFE5|nr:saccharopine dehydrogenase family protein [Actinokineospora enzanensis]